VAADLRGDLDNIVAMALRRNPEERYRTAELLAQDPAAISRARAGIGRPRSVGYLAAKFVRQEQDAVASACLNGDCADRCRAASRCGR
jgi:hypothetical protein